MPMRILYPHDLPVRCKSSVEKTSLDRLEISIAISAVDDGMKIGVQRHWMSAARQTKIRRIGLALYVNIAERPAIISYRGQNSCDPSKISQICVRERIISGNRRGPRLALLEWSEISNGINVAHRLGIDQCG